MSPHQVQSTAVRDIYGRPYVVLNSVPSIFEHAHRGLEYVCAYPYPHAR